MLWDDIFVYYIKNADVEEVNTSIHIFKQDCGKIYWVNNAFANSQRILRYNTIYCLYCIYWYTLFYLIDFISAQNCPDLETIVWHRLKSTTALMIIWYPFNISVGFQDSYFKYWVYLKIYCCKCLGTDALKCFALPDFPPS